MLSEFAGAADELKQAYLVNPHDINGLKEAMWGAMQASPRELRRRMRAMRKQVREHDIDTWASNVPRRPARRTETRAAHD